MSKKYKRFIIVVPEEFHAIAKRQAKEMNMTLRDYLLGFFYTEVINREHSKN